MNNVTISGRLTRQPDIRYSQSEQALCIANFSVAIDRKSKKSQQKADFINCTAFGNIAEFVETYVTTGDYVEIRGRIQSSSYKDKDGNNRSAVSVVVDELETGPKTGWDERRRNRENGSSAGPDPSEPVAAANQNAPGEETPAVNPANDFLPYDGMDDELPFE